MDPLTEETFGVDEPARYGDLYTAAYVLIGGGKDVQEAVAALSQYGLADPDADLAAPIAPGEVWQLFSALVGQSIDPLTETADPEAVTRGELAEALMALMSDGE